jgi:hypothetical protein
VADIIEVECEEVYATKYVRISASRLYSRCDKLYWRSPPYGHDAGASKYGFVTGPSFSVELDNDGNATTRSWSGPSCATGENLIAAQRSAPFTTGPTTGFHGAAATAHGSGRVRHAPSSKIEDRNDQQRGHDRQVQVPARVR